jgi:hypothetical protein
MPASKKKGTDTGDGAELAPTVLAELERRVNQVKQLIVIAAFIVSSSQLGLRLLARRCSTSHDDAYFPR